MNYLETTEYLTYGLEATTDQSWITAASAVIDAHCRRATLGVNQYEERLKMAPDLNTVRVSYLPMAIVSPATSEIVSLRGRYGMPRRGDWPSPEITVEISTAFGLPGNWTSIDPATIEVWADSGELTFPLNSLGLFFNEVDVTYNAGLATIPSQIKVACAQVVKNAQATPALNVKSGKLDRMRLEYFSGALVDETVRSLLAPYVATKGG